LDTAWVIALVVVVLVIASVLVHFRGEIFRKIRGLERPQVLEPGWQFYPRPTVLEPPGQVFRVDEHGRRLMVEALEVASHSGAEEVGRHHEVVEARMSMVARLIGIGGIGASSAKAGRLVFELQGAEREYVEDTALNKVLESQQIEQQTTDRYFVIRESLSARGITYRLEDEQLAKLGGEAMVTEAATLSGTLHAFRSHGSFTLDKTFETPYRVMFLAEELLPPAPTPELEGPTRDPPPGPARSRTLEEPLELMDSGKTELDFVVDELLTPLVQRLDHRWLRAVEGQIAREMLPTLRNFVNVVAASTSDGGKGELEAARDELRHYVERNPGVADSLGRIARKPSVYVEPDADDDVKRLEAYHAKLVFAFDRVERLGRPVALHGFLNSTRCVTVIDARAERSSLLYLPERPTKSPFDPLRPRIWLALSDSVAQAADGGRPRVWIMRTETDEDRDSLAAELNRQFSRPKADIGEPRSFGKKLPREPSAGLVGYVEDDLVHIAEAGRVASSGTSVTEELREQVTQAVRKALDEGEQPEPPKHDEFYAIDLPTGIDLLRDHLEQQLKEKWEADLKWT
jgi:hypothetical protein